MHFSLRSRRLTSLVLAWFVAVLCAAAAAPVLGKGVMQIVCSAGGVKAIPASDQPAEPPSHLLQCPACFLILGAPPALASLQAPIAGDDIPAPPLSAAPLHRRATFSWNARGPPLA